MSTICNRSDLQTLGFQPIMPKNVPNHMIGYGCLYSRPKKILDEFRVRSSGCEKMGVLDVATDTLPLNSTT